MFRIPEAAVDPSTITGAVVETTSSPQLGRPLHATTRSYTVDLLDESVEPSWGTQNYDEHQERAPATARVYPETTTSGAAGPEYAFTFTAPTSRR